MGLRRFPGLAFVLRPPVLLALLLFMTGCLKHSPLEPNAAGLWPAAPAPGDFFSQNGASLTADGLAGSAQDARYILIGEGHTSACDHLAQAAAIKALVGSGLRPAVGLEMIPVDKQAALDEFNSGKIELADLEKAVDWKQVWGFDFALYAPIFSLCREFGLPLYALNAPHALIRKAAQAGLEHLSPQERALLPERIIPPPARQQESLREEFKAHQSMPRPAGRPGAEGEPKDLQAAPKATFERFLFVQSLWDSQMAARALAAFAASGRPVVILAGGGHVEFGYGIAHRLSLLDPGARVFSILPWRGGSPPEQDEASAYFFCPEPHSGRLGFTLEMRGGAVTVADVAPGSKADLAGIRPGDVIAAAGGQPTTALSDLHRAAIKAMLSKKALTLEVKRDGGGVHLTIDLAGPMPSPDEK